MKIVHPHGPVSDKEYNVNIWFNFKKWTLIP